MTDFCTAFTAHGTPGCTTLPFVVDCLYNCFCLSLFPSPISCTDPAGHHCEKEGHPEVSWWDLC